jgi:hypothetical protein
MLDRPRAIRRNIGMPLRVRFLLLLSALTAFAGSAWAQAAPLAEPRESSVWVEALNASPGAWAALGIAAVLAAALAGHLGYLWGRDRSLPGALVEKLERSMEVGNYQEAWETCNQWSSAYLARLLQPALERIGHGLERVESAVARRAEKERRTAAILTWSLLGVGAGIPLLCLLISWAALRALFHSQQTTIGPRVLTMATGDFALLAAMVFAIVAPSLLLWLYFRRAIHQGEAAAREQVEKFLKDLAYDDLEGVRIGHDFDAGTLLGADAEEAPLPSGRLRVSRELTTACPSCNAPINPSRNPCPYCGTAFEWS